MRPLLAALLLGLSFTAQAAPLPPPARAEVNALLERLQTSGCSFNRNGSWYGGSDAKDHLLQKLAYLENKELVHSTEQFIDLAATRSSISGKAYLVRCGAGQPVESRVWLGAELATLRRAPAASAVR